MAENPEEQRSIISMLEELKAQQDLRKANMEVADKLNQCVTGIVQQCTVVVKQISDMDKEGTIDESCQAMNNAISDLTNIMVEVSGLKHDVEFSEEKRRYKT